jgi:LmbE family N-acetylglucosaminyl deacetylase
LIFPELLAEGYEPHNVKRLYVHGTEAADIWVDIRDQMDLKLEALRKHASQFDEDPGGMIREWAAETGKSKDLEYAEAFRVMILVNEEHR